jgi:tRNA dimethylallyltransferase
MARDALAIVGPTASGKTAVAIDVARRIGGEIISMDSRQVYRGMDIGTAKPGAAERAGVPHHGFDRVEPAERYSAGRFAREAWQWIDEIRARGRVPILAGGTGFFLRALTDPLFDEPPAPATRREALKKYLRALDEAALRRWADALDPTAGRSQVRAGGRQRAARAIEVALVTGRSLSWWHRQPTGARVLRPLVVALEVPLDVLRERIDRRVDTMVGQGLVEEVQALLARGLGPADPAWNATGYIEMVPCLRGEYDLDEAKQRIRTATRQYARRQRTWFRHQLPADAVRLNADRPRAEVVDDIQRLWEEGQ